MATPATGARETAPATNAREEDPDVGPSIWSGSIGRKTIVAVTGLGLSLFTLGHMLGNLQYFLGRDQLNGYAEHLHAIPALLWMIRLVLLLVFVAHVRIAVRLWAENRRARPERYVRERTLRATWSSRTMLLTGLVLFVFLVYHVLHFTTHTTNPEYDALYDVDRQPVVLAPGEVPRGEARKDVHAMVTTAFASPWISAVYLLVQIPLWMHLSHGTTSLLQTLGLNTRTWTATVERIGVVFASVVVAGNLSVPLVVLWKSLG